MIASLRTDATFRLGRIGRRRRIGHFARRGKYIFAVQQTAIEE
jgi:hypothetical protein